MARPLRIEFPGAIYHVTSRGDRREPIFEDDEDRRSFLANVGLAMDRFDATVLAYCLMDNHYHLVIHTRRANLSRLMQQLNGIYTQAYNRRHSKVGHLFQGRFKGILVDENAYLLEVCRYVDLNPHRARMVRDPANWAWSSYRAHVGKENAPEWLDTPAVHGYVLGRDAITATDKRRAAERYAAHVAAGKGVKLWDEALSNQIFLGGQDFVARMQALIEADSRKSKDIPRAQRRTPVKSITQYLTHKAGRDAGIVAAARDGQHSLSAIAREAGLSVSRVSRIVKQQETNAG
ncbi:MAG: transposase, partial [Betaproteobacteria bacterium]|nr:transposase [Betaproteobacteria bacterium]